MSDTDMVFEDVFDAGKENYIECLAKVKKAVDDRFGTDTELSTVQSVTATVYINANKEKSSVANLMNVLKEKIAKLNPEAIPSAISVWKWHFRDFINVAGPRLTGRIAYYVSQNMTPEEIERNTKEYYFHLMCETLSKEESEALANDLFGDNEHD